jgi:hypothetical protein
MYASTWELRWYKKVLKLDEPVYVCFNYIVITLNTGHDRNISH